MRPRILITAGDPNGIGPEVIAAAWSDERLHTSCLPVAVGPPGVLRQAVKLLDAPVEVEETAVLSDGYARSRPDRMPCLAVGPNDLRPTPGQITAIGGEVAFGAVTAAVEHALQNACDAIVTAPLSKAALHAAGKIYPGHTELLAELCGVQDFAMMLYLPPGEQIEGAFGLGVVHVTLHTSLRSVPDLLSIDAIAAKCRLAHRALQRLGAAQPRVAVAALNPHGGESGLFGDEESRVIAPAVACVRAEGLLVSGPYPTDTLMMRARHGEFDAVVAMYHDQGHIALKLLGMHAAVNITLGLPIVRTSVAHGTAPDLAWKGQAEPAGLIAAARTAALLAATR
ncbi:4-hydroxythreonine-4-phosphate dehydrogenase [Pirellulimonas nuda]|uniref:4-hydroxythreonine-4-phosphate dehydrogenase n=1 Tax=Pirellulimonas nuda TaxID=2528009 RepID=A0A518DA27_9BACT|nr:4-hydroxythreonine-4-phosphate dehydrogenase PdxA [Pirellulimonas nuda]QDU88340.1 4-hydroxythreonine-4-phosphate dehydrogenase [Pirellulimonas nuda]